MKKILITGANSYVGTNVKRWLMREPDKYHVDTLDMIDPNWINYDFSGYDVIFHVAGIAHVSSKKSMEDLYFKVNRDLAIDTAEKAKKSGVRQFVFMSSMIVFGDSSMKEEVISNETIPTPSNYYGESKLEAENAIMSLSCEGFNISIIRSPMIYGPNSRGNYRRLSRYKKLFIILPNKKNKKSMLFIYNLCEFVRLIIDDNGGGFFHPQNKEQVSTIELIKKIREVHGMRSWFVYFPNLFHRLFGRFIISYRKLFGNQVYAKSMDNHYEYCIFSFDDSIEITEGVKKIG